MFRKAGTFLVIGSLSIVFFSCSNYQKIQKSQDFSYKYEKALEYYEREDYYRAMNLFDQVIPFYRGSAEAEDIAYKYAYGYYNQKQYIMASYYFDRFAKTYPRSERAEECMFMTAYCKYLDSPKFKLDQTSTVEAISALQLFLNAYPASDRVDQCNALISVKFRNDGAFRRGVFPVQGEKACAILLPELSVMQRPEQHQETDGETGDDVGDKIRKVHHSSRLAAHGS